MASLSSVRANPVRVAAPAARRATAQRAAAVRVCAAGKSYSITLLPGDGIGPEIMKVAVDCLNVVVRTARGCSRSDALIQWYTRSARANHAADNREDALLAESVGNYLSVHTPPRCRRRRRSSS